MQRALSRRLVVRNRITWEREKGRAAARNWKAASEDVWFATVSEDYQFDAAAVRLRRLVRAPYRDLSGEPKDWSEGSDGKLRDTAASNLWTDLVVPFWSMPENTSHPTQKPEKLVAKLLLASSRPGDLVLDPFLGSGTTAVVARKLGRRFIGVEADPEHCLAALRRLELAREDSRIQGYDEGVFWERNSGPRRSHGRH
jgi:site-specific DNA-methyltransferase (adenine-specific)